MRSCSTEDLIYGWDNFLGAMRKRKALAWPSKDVFERALTILSTIKVCNMADPQDIFIGTCNIRLNWQFGCNDRNISVTVLDDGSYKLSSWDTNSYLDTKKKIIGSFPGVIKVVKKIHLRLQNTIKRGI
jgi:hypothetical protein